MTAFICRPFCPLLVLSIGFLSCQKSNPSDSAAPYRIEKPRWETKAGTVAFGEDQDEPEHWTKKLDLTDSLLISGSPAGTLQVASQCSAGEHFWTEKLDLPLLQRTPLFRMLPKTVLSPRFFTLGPVRCTLDFHAINKNGSTHHFHMPGVEVRDSGESFGINDAATGMIHRQDRFATDRFQIQASSATLRILCDQAEAVGLRHGGSDVWLSDFRFKRENSARPPAEQRCRMIGLDGVGPNSYSSIFVVSFQSLSPTLTVRPIRTMAEISGRPPINFLSFTTSNPSEESISFKLLLPSIGSWLIVNLEDVAQADLLASPPRTDCRGVQPLGDVSLSYIVDDADPDVGFHADSARNLQIDLPPKTRLTGHMQLSHWLVGYFPSVVFIQPNRPLKMEVTLIDTEGHEKPADAADWGQFNFAWVANSHFPKLKHFQLPETAKITCTPRPRSEN